MKHLAIAAACAVFVALPAKAATTIVEFPLATTLSYQFTFSEAVDAEISITVLGYRIFEEYGGNTNSVELDASNVLTLSGQRRVFSAFPGRHVQVLPGWGNYYSAYNRLEYTVTGTDLVPTLRLNSAFGVPEPATWALMILGFGAVGSAMRRRRLGLAC